jgi:triosephosphate isomerase
MTKKIIIANWKMNHSFDEIDQWLNIFFDEAAKNAEKFTHIEPVICPPHVFIEYIDSELMNENLQNLEAIIKAEQKTFDDYSEDELNKMLLESRLITVGAQDCHHEEKGAFTGSVSAKMLADLGCDFVILGHSERRSYNFETSDLVAKKVARAISQKITPVICVGESLEVRNSGQYLDFILQQLSESMPQDILAQRIIVAYEPIWSIGTGLVPNSQQISEVVTAIKNHLAENFSDLARNFAVLYGGSVSSKNSAEILRVDGVDGLLIGGASLGAPEFLQICFSN